MRIGRDCLGQVGCGVDMQRVGAIGRRWFSSSCGVRMGCGEGDRDDFGEDPSGGPEGILAAQARILARSLGVGWEWYTTLRSLPTLERVCREERVGLSG